MKSSASPAADRSRRLWRRGPESAPVPSLDADEAAAVVRRSVGALEEPRVVVPLGDARSAAAERVIAQAVAGGLTDPREAPATRRGRRHRRTEDQVGDLVEHVPVVETPEPVAVPTDLRRELEQAAEVAHQAREVAERAAAEHAEALVRMEDAAKEQAASARNEAVRRRAAEQLASESAEQVAVAHAERVRVEVEAKRQFELAAQAAEAHAAAERAAQESAERAAATELSERLARAESQAADLTAARQTQLLQSEAAHAARAEAEAAAMRATLEREAAEARAQHLAATLEATRTQLLEQTRATLAAERARAEAAPIAPPARVAAPTVSRVSESPTPEPDARIWPDGAGETVRFRSPSSSAVLTVVLGLGALVAAGFAVYQAYLDKLVETPGIVAAVVTLVLVVAVGRTKNESTSVWLEQGVLHVENDEWHRKVDLTTRETLVQMVGQPGEKRWKVLFLRKSQPTYEIDGSVVDPHEFVPVLRRWRPEL